MANVAGTADEGKFLRFTPKRKSCQSIYKTANTYITTHLKENKILTKNNSLLLYIYNTGRNSKHTLSLTYNNPFSMEV